MIIYENLITELQKQNCILLNSKEEFDIIQKNDPNCKVDIQSSCGHKHHCFPYHLKNRSFELCKKCRNTNTSGIMKEFNNNSKCKQIEQTGYLHVYNYLSPFFEIKKTNEGCKADFIIRLKKSVKNEWIPIQLKVTTKICYNMYSFKYLNKKYENYFIICYCLEEDKLWLMSYNFVSHLKGNLNISKKSKYNKFLVSKDTIYEHILKYISYIKYVKYEECMIPQSQQQIQEYEYINIREEHLPFLHFVKPELENSKVDFYINNFKFQEKNSYKHRKHDIICLAVHNGTENKKRKWRTYKKGEINFYWFNIRPTFIFYVIPEEILFQHNFISDTDEIQNKTRLTIDNNQDWLEPYKFDYKNVDKNKLFHIINIT